MQKKALLGLIIAWLSYIPLGFWIVETHTFGAIYESLNLSQSILRYYITENAFDLAFMGILTIGLFILVIHRFKYTMKPILESQTSQKSWCYRPF